MEVDELRVECDRLTECNRESNEALFAMKHKLQTEMLSWPRDLDAGFSELQERYSKIEKQHDILKNGYSSLENVVRDREATIVELREELSKR